ncbi:MAG: flagellin [Selenomonadaceae bacterium]|nr:flagellin [Selenomonadaceae bacterium]
MSMAIRNNITALRSYNVMSANHVKAQKSLTKVSTGEKINSAQDDSAAFSISERMRNRIRSLEQAHRNTQNGNSMIRTASEAVDTITETLRSLKEKAINAANDANTDDDRKTLQKEVDQLIDQIDDTALVTFNGKYLIDNTKNHVSTETKTILLNQGLDKSTALTDNLTDLKNRAGDTLGITTDDKYQVSWVVNGKTSTTTGDADSKTLKDLLEAPTTSVLTAAEVAANATAGTDKYGLEVYTPDKTEGITLTAATAGVKDQIAGFTVSITDPNGNIRSVANAALNQFNELQRGEVKTDDYSLNFQVGAESNVATRIALTDMRASALGLRGEGGQTVSVKTKDDANAAISVIDNAIKKVADEQAALGALVARLDYTAENLTTSFTNDKASESGMRDADMAREITNYTTDNIRVQTSQAMLVQANQQPEDVLALLR